MPGGLTSWCEIDAAALEANVGLLRRRLSPGALLGIVVKSDAYGHGLIPCARLFAAAGADWLVVNSAAEAQLLRRVGLALPLYICSRVPPAHCDLAATCRARVVVCDGEDARALAQAGRQAGEPVRVHIKIETGTHRQGLPLGAALELGRLVVRLEGVALEGLTTHYADIEDTTDHAFARRQLGLLEEARQAFAAAGMPPPMVHSANSAATILWPQTHASLVRVGLAAYGLWPSRETYATALQRGTDGLQGWLPELSPVLSWRACLGQVKEVPAGGYVGYGRTFRATYPMRIGVVPVGYYEGYDRRLSNVGHVLVHGVRAPVRGRVCMNMLLVDLTHIPQARPAAVVTLLGRDGEEWVSADQWAAWMHSINYEVVSRIHQGQPRLVRRADGGLEEV
ncbi:MAG: alanine racemase [Candidatus Latescibacterota bacterium]